MSPVKRFVNKFFAPRMLPTFEAAMLPDSGHVIVSCSDGRASEEIVLPRALAIHAAVERHRRLEAMGAVKPLAGGPVLDRTMDDHRDPV